MRCTPFPARQHRSEVGFRTGGYRGTPYGECLGSQRRRHRAPDGHPDPSHDAVGEVLQRLALEEHEEPGLQAGRRGHRQVTAAGRGWSTTSTATDSRTNPPVPVEPGTGDHACARHCGMVHMPLTGAGGKRGRAGARSWSARHQARRRPDIRRARGAEGARGVGRSRPGRLDRRHGAHGLPSRALLGDAGRGRGVRLRHPVHRSGS